MTTEPVAGVVKPAPYVAFADFEGLVEVLPSSLEPGAPLEPHVRLVAGKSNSKCSELSGTLRALGLADGNGSATERLVELAGESDRQGPYRALVEEFYPEPLTAVLDGASTAELETLFDGCGRNGGTRKRAITFFVSLASAAGLRLEGAARSGGSHSTGVERQRSRPNDAYQRLLLKALDAALESCDSDETWSRFERLCDRFERSHYSRDGEHHP